MNVKIDEDTDWYSMTDRLYGRKDGQMLLDISPKG